MKLSLLVLLLYSLSLGSTSFSQDKIEGIGRFKVGKATISLVQAIATETRVPVAIVDTSVKVDKLAKSQIVEIKSSAHAGRASIPSFSSSLCAHVRVFYLNNYREADIDLQSVYLYFADDVLVKFTCYATSKLNSALETKYGQPEANIVKLYSDCDYDAKSFILTWPNDSIVATLSLLVSYDSNCRKRVSQEFTMALKEKESQLEGCDGIAAGLNK
jgi:hypothetical protein